MKSWTLRFRVEDKKNFDEVESGVKSIETRAGTVKYQPIEIGDALTFVCGKNKCVKRIVKKFHWKSINAMVKDVGIKKVMPSVRSLAEMKKIYASYPDYEKKIKENGLLGFEVK